MSQAVGLLHDIVMIALDRLKESHERIVTSARYAGVSKMCGREMVLL